MSRPAKKSELALALGALGVVFGDIGTSPLYAFEAAVTALGSSAGEDVLGVASLIVWTIMFIVTIKYVCVVMRADYRGEGGVFALLGLLQSRLGSSRRRRLPAYVILLLIGASLLLGDGTITPAISVLSAMEGLAAVDADLQRAVVPATVVILAGLFAIQRLGTGRLGRCFGIVMVVWFVTIGGIGAYWITRSPEVLQALNPLLAIETLFTAGPVAFFVLGAVVLAVTGVEALYADMGHFSRRAISLAWHGLALPALILNYLGQCALALEDKSAFASGTPFFEMVPAGWPALSLVILATIATVVASQALISGVFSLSAQAHEMGFAPRLQVRHTSSQERGQVYVPVVNWVLGILCILLVLTFRSSANLAAAYGLAVVGTMVITSIILGMVARYCWNWKPWQAYGMSGIFLLVEIPFLLSCLTKLPEGAYFPILIGGGFFVVMVTWARGREIILETIRGRRIPLKELAARLESMPRSPGQFVFISSNPRADYAVARSLEMVRRGAGMRDQVLILSMVSSVESYVDIDSSVSVREVSPRLWHISANYGYMQEPCAPKIVDRARELSKGSIHPETNETFYVLPRELIVEYTGRRMTRWQRALFGFLSRNVSYAPDYFYIPTDQIVEFTWMVRT